MTGLNADETGLNADETGLNADEPGLLSDETGANQRQRSAFFAAVETYDRVLAESTVEIARLTALVESNEAMIRDQAAVIELNRLVILDLSEGRSAVLASTSWRLTRPVRAIADLLRRGARS